jgi:hypothetical protein
MAEDEHDKVSVVVESNTIINPNAMMVKFFNANVTHTAVF